MPSDAARPEHAWKRLRQGKHEAQGISIPTVASDVETRDGAVRHALGAQGEARLLVPIGMHERLKPFPQSPSLRVSDATYQQDGHPVRFIDMTCLVSELDSVFSEVSEELLRRILDGKPAQNAVRSTINDFRALLLDPPAREVSDSEIIGIVGELLVLCRLLRLSPSATEAWRGPTGERHDFRRRDQALEVKTTSRSADYAVSISAIDQLDAPAGGSLHLVHLILERDPNGSLNISRLTAEAKSLADAPGDVTDLLALVGCPDPDAENWNRLSFSEEAVTYFEIRNGFPKIGAVSFSSGALPDGITAIEYTIDLAQASEFVVTSDAVKDVELSIAE